MSVNHIAAPRTFTDRRMGVSYVYEDLCQTVMDEGAVVPSRNGTTRELHPVTIAITDTSQPLITVRHRPINVAFALAEVIWILLGRKDVAMLEHYNSRITEYSDDGETFNAAYGFRLRHTFGQDQLDSVVELLKRDPDSRQAVLNIWSPMLDSPRHNTKDRACNVLSHLLIREGQLDWLQIIRSNDLMWGVPYNWMQWMHVQRWVAELIHVPVGTFYHVADSLHVYEEFWPEARQVRSTQLLRWVGVAPPQLEASASTLEQLKVWEEMVRQGGTGSLEGCPLNWYWKDVLAILLAHRFYKKHDNEKALLVLAAGRSFYGAAQAHFYWTQRWQAHNPNLTVQISEAWGNEVAQWICGD